MERYEERRVEQESQNKSFNEVMCGKVSSNTFEEALAENKNTVTKEN